MNKHITDSLATIEARCRLKAEAARWAAERQHRMHDGIPHSVAIEPRDGDLIERAKTLGCFLWTNGPDCPRPDDLQLFELLAACFEVAAEAASLLRVCDGESDDLMKRCLEVAAEAQSALRSAAMAIGHSADSDQQAIFDWLRATAEERSIFISRFLRVDDPADPFATADLLDRIRDARERCEASRKQKNDQTSRFKRLRYHAQMVEAGRGTDHDWNKIVNTATELIDNGVPPSNLDIRSAVLPVMGMVPDWHFPQAFQLVLRETQSYLATRPTPAAPRQRALPQDVKSVRNFLKGTCLVIVGGDPREVASQALREAFDLKDVLWLESQPHKSLKRFKPFMKRGDVKVIVLLICLASHSYGGLKRLCNRQGKLFVRLPGGYSPNQVANQVMSQCGYLRTQEGR